MSKVHAYKRQSGLDATQSEWQRRTKLCTIKQHGLLDYIKTTLK